MSKINYSNNHPSFIIEKEYWDKNYVFVAGVDEVGRGSLAGPICACAVIFKPNSDDDFIKQINDSKKLTIKQREELFILIRDNCLDFSVSFIDNLTIDKIGIQKANKKAMYSSVKGLKTSSQIILSDYLDFNLDGLNKLIIRPVLNGDNISVTIAAASILAKVTRDTWMKNIAHKKYPMYGFDTNVGYGTKNHLENIKRYGLCPLHRKSFGIGLNKSQIKIK